MKTLTKPSDQPTFELAISAHIADSTRELEACIRDDPEQVPWWQDHILKATRARQIYHRAMERACDQAAQAMRASLLPEEFVEAALGDLTALDI